MRVLFDCRMQEWTGVGRYTVSLASALAERGDVELVQMVSAGADAPVPGLEIVTAHHPVISYRGFREFGSIARSVAPDLTHCVQYPTPAPSTHPLVVTLHDTIPVAIPGSMPSRLRRTIYAYMNRRALRVADRVIVDSAHTARDLGVAFGADPAEMKVVLLAADDFAAGPVGALPDAAVAPFLLSMGNTKPHKNLAALLAAFTDFAATHPEHRLLLVGADDPAFLTAHVPDRTVRERVRFTGRVGDPELRALYAACDAFVFPSLHEGFGLPPLEAMHFGAPVICSNATSLPEVVGDAALLFEPRDTSALASALSAVAGDPALRTRLADAGRARAAQFTWAHTAEETVAVYRSLLS